jgi:hypothetical protein
MRDPGFVLQVSLDRATSKPESGQRGGIDGQSAPRAGKTPLETRRPIA